MNSQLPLTLHKASQPTIWALYYRGGSLFSFIPKFETINSGHTFNPVALIFSANWSTATLLGAQTKTWKLSWEGRKEVDKERHKEEKSKWCLENVQEYTCPWPCLAMWYTSAAEVTVLPVPGGPWIKLIGLWRTLLTAYTYIVDRQCLDTKFNIQKFLVPSHTMIWQGMSPILFSGFNHLEYFNNLEY